MKFLLLEDPCHQFTRLAVTVFHRIDQGQSDLAFLQITEHRLSELLTGSGEIEQVVDKLKSKASVAAVVRKHILVLIVHSAEYGAQPRAAAEKASGLVRRQLQGVFFGHVHAADLRELNQF